MRQSAAGMHVNKAEKCTVLGTVIKQWLVKKKKAEKTLCVL
jgi:hypothetical protein